MYPWQQINLPRSGNLVQRMDADSFFDAITTEAGDGEIEKEVFKRVSYGRQLSLLTKVLLALIEESGAKLEENKALAELKMIRKEIEAIKQSKKDRLKKHARRILDKLKESDPETFSEVLRTYMK